ncbi:MAG: peptidase [Glaciihabitans sp.]|nr:peptidase [Glaciihabitans sp.]
MSRMTTPNNATIAGTDVDSSINDIITRAGTMAPLHTFPGVDELLATFDAMAEANPDSITRRRIGTSRDGDAIHEYVIGAGTKHILVYAGVHPNEPIGFHTVQRLAEDLVKEPELLRSVEAVWHIIPCIDPDGARLNEGWFANPSDRAHYARNFYRPAPTEQVEWSFPLAYKDAYFDRSMPETQALMRLIDETHPILLVGLHNAELGGVYYYLGRDIIGAVDDLHAIPTALGLPLDVGEPESADLHVIAPAVFLAPLATDHYDYLESLGIDPVAEVSGGGSADYARRYGSVTFIAELPYWSHPDAVDTRPSGVNYKDVLSQKAEGLLELGAVLEDALAAALPHLQMNTPFLRASRAFVPMMAVLGTNEKQRSEHPDSDREATIAEVFTNNDFVRCFRLRFGGMLVRAINAEVHAGIAPTELRHIGSALNANYTAWIAESDAVEGLAVLPIERLVGVQYASTLAVAARLLAEPAR